MLNYTEMIYFSSGSLDEIVQYFCQIDDYLWIR